MARLRGILHHGEVDADLLRLLVLGSEYIGAARRSPGRDDALDGGMKFGLAGFELAENRGWLPDEDATIPEILPGRDELLRHGRFGLFLKLAHARHENLLSRAGVFATANIAITGGGE